MDIIAKLENDYDISGFSFLFSMGALMTIIAAELNELSGTVLVIVAWSSLYIGLGLMYSIFANSAVTRLIVTYLFLLRMIILCVTL